LRRFPLKSQNLAYTIRNIFRSKIKFSAPHLFGARENFDERLFLISFFENPREQWLTAPWPRAPHRI
jgi:hypothetical protein